MSNGTENAVIGGVDVRQVLGLITHPGISDADAYELLKQALLTAHSGGAAEGTKEMGDHMMASFDRVTKAVAP